MELALHPNELLLFYHGRSQRARRTLAFAQSVSGHINLRDLNTVRLTKIIWLELLTMLDLEPKELLNKSHPDYQEKIKGRSLTMDNWLEVLVQNPHLVKAPIAVIHKNAMLCIRPKDVLNWIEQCYPADQLLNPPRF